MSLMENGNGKALETDMDAPACPSKNNAVRARQIVRDIKKQVNKSASPESQKIADLESRCAKLVGALLELRASGTDLPQGLFFHSRSDYVNEEQLKLWVRYGHVNPENGNRIDARSALRDIFFEKGNRFWKTFEEFARTFSEEEYEAIGGRIPTTHSSFDPRLKKNGYPDNTPKNALLYLWALDHSEAENCHHNGTLSLHGMVRWCHEGYEDPITGDRKFGKTILKEARGNGNFWTNLQRYCTNLTVRDYAAMGGRFPKVGIRSYFSEFLIPPYGITGRNITVEQAFFYLWLELPKKEYVRAKIDRLPPPVIPKKEIGEEERVAIGRILSKIIRMAKEERIAINMEDVSVRKDGISDRRTFIFHDQSVLTSLLPYRNFIDDELVSAYAEASGKIIAVDWSGAYENA